MKIFLDKPDTCPLELDFFKKLVDIIVLEISDDYEFSDETELSIVLTDDIEIKEMNKNYRNKDSATDVLSFPMDEELMLGDIVISFDTAKRQAEEVDIAFEREIAFLFTHGFLHLIGFDHEVSKEEETEMFDLQEKILKIMINKEVIV